MGRRRQAWASRRMEEEPAGGLQVSWKWRKEPLDGDVASGGRKRLEM